MTRQPPVRLGDALLLNDDCMTVLAALPENSVDSIVTDPPYGIGFMAKGWDAMGAGPAQRAWHSAWLAEALRVLKPGGHLLAFGGSRTVQHLAVAAEDCGFEIRDMLMWVYGSGMGLAARLKPAHEPIVLARKPFTGSARANVQTWGVGALNIDAARVGPAPTTRTPSGLDRFNAANAAQGYRPAAYAQGPVPAPSPDKGRWPANFMHDGSDEVTALLPGDAASFFYSAKVMTGEREYGTSSLPMRTLARSGGAQGAEARGEDYDEGQGIGLNRVQARRNIHPTVKPVALLSHLQRLVTPPGGLTLDIFAGSGSAGIAAAFGGFRYIGAEIDTVEGYFPIACARVQQAQADATAGCTWEQALIADKVRQQLDSEESVD